MSRFWRALLGVTAVGAAVRVAFALSVWSRPLSGDGSSFHLVAANLVSGRGYDFFPGEPTAVHPPVFTVLLAMFDALGISSIGAQRIAVSIVASAGVILVGLLGKRVGGSAVGIFAAVIAALDPIWFQSSGILMSESVYLIAVPGVLLVAFACIDRPSAWRLGSLGALIALATLIRSEAIDLALILGVPVVLMASRRWWRRGQFALALAFGVILVLTPWLVRNEIQLGGATLSTNGGETLLGSYSFRTFDPHSPDYGSFDGAYAITEGIQIAKAHSTDTDLMLNQAVTQKAETFARGHLSDLPGVVVARERSVWGFGDQGFQLKLAEEEGRAHGWERTGDIVYWVLLPFVILGMVQLARRSRRDFIVVIVPLVVVALNVAIFYGSTRMRMVAEPSLAVFAAAGLVAARAFVRSRYHFARLDLGDQPVHLS